MTTGRVFDFTTDRSTVSVFAQASGNGALERVVRIALRGCRGNVGLMPVMFFGLALGVASIGAGNIASSALVGPMAMVIAALCAEGTSTIGDAYQIDKGYERIDERLRALGARIERVES